MRGQIPCIEYFIKQGVNVNSKASNGMTPVFSAVWSKKPLPTLKRLKELGAKLDLKTQNGKTPLDFAKEDGLVEVEEWLRTNGER